MIQHIYSHVVKLALCVFSLVSVNTLQANTSLKDFLYQADFVIPQSETSSFIYARYGDDYHIYHEGNIRVCPQAAVGTQVTAQVGDDLLMVAAFEAAAIDTLKPDGSMQTLALPEPQPVMHVARSGHHFLYGRLRREHIELKLLDSQTKQAQALTLPAPDPHRQGISLLYKSVFHEGFWWIWIHRSHLLYKISPDLSSHQAITLDLPIELEDYDPNVSDQLVELIQAGDAKALTQRCEDLNGKIVNLAPQVFWFQNEAIVFLYDIYRLQGCVNDSYFDTDYASLAVRHSSKATQILNVKEWPQREVKGLLGDKQVLIFRTWEGEDFENGRWRFDTMKDHIQ